MYHYGFTNGASRTSSVEPVSHETRNVGFRTLQSNYATYINKYTLEGDNKMINARINTMHSNRTSILRIAALIPLLGFGADNKKFMFYATPIAQGPIY
jgi:hypothetical protein